MKGSGLKGAIPRPRGRLRGFIGWWVRGPWWGKTAKLAAVAVILYNVVTFFAMWCPPVRGVVLDIDTHKPIAGAIVQKDAVGPFAFFPAMTQAGGRTGGGDAQAETDASGRFSFPGVLAHPTSRTHSWFDVLWPFQWLDTIDITVWHVDYIGAYSCAKGMWWREMPPYHSAGYCQVKRYRIPLLGFRYTILLKKPQTEADWRVKIGSVNLAGIEGGNEAEDERLFDDLTGYLERWPDTPYEKARLPTLLGGYAKADYQHNEWVLDCAKLRAAELADRKMFLQKFEFLGTWLQAKMVEQGLTPVDNLPSGGSPKTSAERLLVEYTEWSRYARQVHECMGGGK